MPAGAKRATGDGRRRGALGKATPQNGWPSVAGLTQRLVRWSGDPMRPAGLDELGRRNGCPDAAGLMEGLA
ncbi:hypothetical protein GCM10022419_016530 [Nonomuraea rosea]|uniref:Uncharacterized protein n=1 Tax=Nonomuraea rosea TaxID=638574 RepID=A0ABP6VPC7_9ACTN